MVLSLCGESLCLSSEARVWWCCSSLLSLRMFVDSAVMCDLCPPVRSYHSFGFTGAGCDGLVVVYVYCGDPSVHRPCVVAV